MEEFLASVAVAIVFFAFVGMIGRKTDGCPDEMSDDWKNRNNGGGRR